MSNVYRDNCVVRGNQVRRVINSNDMVAEKLQAILDAQRETRRQIALEAQAAKRGENADAVPEDEAEPAFTEGLVAKEVELEPMEEIDYGAQAREEASQIVEEANAKAAEIREHANEEAQALKEQAHREGYDAGYAEGLARVAEENERRTQELNQRETQLQSHYETAMAELEPRMVDTILTVFDEVFRIQFSGKRELLLSLVSNALRGIRETRQYKIRVCEEEVSVLREHRQELQEQVGEDMTIEIVMDPDLSKSQCIIEADSGVYDCSLDAELDHLSRDLRSISASSVPLQD